MNMNWYKLAFPFSPKIPSMGRQYTDYGHRNIGDFEEVGVWAIDENGKLYAEPLSDHIADHENWSLWYEITQIAEGRYMTDREGNTTVTVVLNDMSSLSESQKEYRRKKVEQILDEGFNNPTIIEF